MLTATHMHPHSAARNLRFVVAAGVIVFAAAMLGILLRPIGYLAVFWPANAIFLGLLLRQPELARLPTFVSVFIGYAAADLVTGGQWGTSVMLTLANMIGITAGWLILRRFDRKTLHMQGQYSALVLLFGSGVAALVSAAIGGPVAHSAFNAPLMQGFVMWWVSEWMNHMMLLPLLMALPSKQLPPLPSKAPVWPWHAMPVLTAAALEVASYVIGGPGALTFSLPALLWCALTYRISSTALITLIVCTSKTIAISVGSFDFTPEHFSEVVSIRLGMTMLILGPLSVAGAHAARSALLQRLNYAANHDSLTDVLSRHGFVQACNLLFKRLSHDGTPIAVLMLDLDHFKRVNDSHGHATGDRLLRDFTRTLAQTLRPQDVLGRIGGEEFAVVLPQISAADAATIAERLCNAVRTEAFLTTQQEPMRATVSIGVAHVTRLQRHDSIETLLRDADIALYQSKASGRDRVVLGTAR